MKMTVVVTLDVERSDGSGDADIARATAATTSAVRDAVKHVAKGDGFVGGDLTMSVVGVRPGTRYVRIEWHPDFDRRRDDVLKWQTNEDGLFAMLPAKCGNIGEAFGIETGSPERCIIAYSTDDLYDSDGNLLT